LATEEPKKTPLDDCEDDFPTFSFASLLSFFWWNGPRLWGINTHMSSLHDIASPEKQIILIENETEMTQTKQFQFDSNKNSISAVLVP
jgi:hypothetical protein